MDDILLEPLKAYETYYADKFKENAQTHIQSLIEKSGLDVEQNRQTVAHLREQERLRDAAAGRVALQKALKTFVILLIVGAIIAAVVGIFGVVNGGASVTSIVLIPVGAVAAIGFILIVVLVINPKIRNTEAVRNKHADNANALSEEAWRQMSALNALFDSNDTKNLIEATVPLLKIDDNFNMRRYDYLNAKYGFENNYDEERSTIAILSGEILGNPFVVDRELVRDMTLCTYTGSLSISWTTTYTDSEGHVHTQTHHQTLTASVCKPKPVYSEQTRLIYGNEAAPDLVFTHEPSHAERLSDKEFESAVKSGMKKIQKQQKQAMKSGESNFTEMGNADFDVMFGALDRNHEVQFRLLFTPLAQKNMLALMRSHTGYGDDFLFAKQNCLNYVSSEHSADWDLDTSYTRYAGYDIDAVCAGFMSFNCNYFKSLFFEFAPLLSIPLYQQHKPKEYIYKTSYGRNYTNYEAECAVNRLGGQVFEHPSSATTAILKTRFMQKDGKSDEIGVRAYSFRAEDRVDYIAVRGGDGYIHDVPVPWVEYIPVERDSVVKLKEIGISDKEYDARLRDDQAAVSTLDMFGNHRAYAHGLLCCLLAAEGDTLFDKHIGDVFKK